MSLKCGHNFYVHKALCHKVGNTYSRSITVPREHSLSSKGEVPLHGWHVWLFWTQTCKYLFEFNISKAVKSIPVKSGGQSISDNST